MATECLCCPCLNVKLYVKDVEARQEDDQLLSNLLSNAHDSSPRLAELVKPVEAVSWLNNAQKPVLMLQCSYTTI